MALLLADPLLIRRPLLEVEDQREVGFELPRIQAWLGLGVVADGLVSEDCARSQSCPVPGNPDPVSPCSTGRGHPERSRRSRDMSRSRQKSPVTLIQDITASRCRLTAEAVIGRSRENKSVRFSFEVSATCHESCATLRTSLLVCSRDPGCAVLARLPQSASQHAWPNRRPLGVRPECRRCRRRSVRPGGCFGEIVVKCEQHAVYFLKFTCRPRVRFPSPNRLFHEANLLGRHSAAHGRIPFEPGGDLSTLMISDAFLSLCQTTNSVPTATQWVGSGQPDFLPIKPAMRGA